MPEILFYHPNVEPKTLSINTGANQIGWSYGLNTQTIPTYGGEVVQILSAYVDDLAIQGDVRTYHKMEKIYKWFLEYMQIATIEDGNPSFIETPVTMYYPERGWELKIKPHSLPGYRIATEVVAPTWQLTAAVQEGDEAMNKLTMKQAKKRGFDFSALHAGIGYDEDNPFTNPAASKSKYDPEEFTGKITDFYQSLIPSYLEGDFDSMFNGGFFGSKPMDDWNKGNQSNKDKTSEKQTIDSILGGVKVGF
jgi:hypothetical protein